MKSHEHPGDPVVLIDRIQAAKDDSGNPATFGFDTLKSAVEATGVSVVRRGHLVAESGAVVIAAGAATDPLVRRLLAHAGVQISAAPEGVILQWCDTSQGRILVASGTDARGLMYAQLELADVVRSGGLDALARVKNQVEFPEHRIRGLNRFIMGPLDEAWLYSDAFWTYYTSRLAHCRFNRLVLVAGFDTAYLSPPYAYFVQVPGYPHVRVKGLDEAAVAGNLARLRHIGRECRKHGLEFIFGTWQQTPWTENQQQLVEGLPIDEEELAGYCAAGLETLLQACPEIDGVHFRVNFEAGMGTQASNEAFWQRMIEATAGCGRRVKLDLRAKGLTDGMIQYALDRGLEVAVPTKYWCEHTGLPHHLTQMRDEELTQLDNLNHSRRYSYADLLRKPRWYDVIYRLWSLGSTTLFLWGDPDYVRRFSASCRLGDAAGFEVAAPLSLKGGHAAIQTEAWPIFADPALRVGTWEDERYWLFYLLYGRLGYSSATPAQVWQRELRGRFGEAAASLERAIRAASKILPLVTAFHMPVHPMLHYWPELSTGAALFPEHNYNRRFNSRYYGEVSYGSAQPSDPGLFHSIDAYARDRTRGAIAAKYTPLQVSGWFDDFAAEIHAAAGAAAEIMGETGGAEYRAARLDLLMLADLATYHANKIRAALALALFRTRQDAASDGQADQFLEEALGWCIAARDAWVSLSKKGSGAYHDPLEFSAGHSQARSGHWQEQIPELDADVARLQEMVRAAQDRRSASAAGKAAAGSGGALWERHWIAPVLVTDVPRAWTAGKDLVIDVRTADTDRFMDGLRLHYRHTNQLEGPFRQVEMVRTDRGFNATIPGDYLQADWDLLIYVSAILGEDVVLIFPGLYSPVYPLPYFLVEIRD